MDSYSKFEILINHSINNDCLIQVRITKNLFREQGQRMERKNKEKTNSKQGFLQTTE